MNSRLATLLQITIVGVGVALFVYLIPVFPIRVTIAIFFGILAVLILQYLRPELIPLRTGQFQIFAAVVFLGSSWKAGVQVSLNNPLIWYESSSGQISAANVLMALMLFISAHLCFRHHRLTKTAEEEHEAEINHATHEQILRLLRDNNDQVLTCLLYTSPSPRDLSTSRMPSSA